MLGLLRRIYFLDYDIDLFFDEPPHGPGQGHVHPHLLEQTRGLPRMEDQNRLVQEEAGSAEETEGGVHQFDDTSDGDGMEADRAHGGQSC